MRSVLDQRMAELKARRTPFVRATVVRARRPTSAHPGDTALVLADGNMEGFVGGTCAEATVRRYGLETLQTGEPLLLRISPDKTGEPVVEEGAVEVGNPCLSGGELEIFLEPVLPAPKVLVLGDTPIGRHLVALGPGLEYDIQAVAAHEVKAESLDGVAAVVVASHGRDEEPLLTLAVRAGVPYVGLVASRKRGEAVLASLDLTPEQRARIRTPAGLEIGARTPGEVALSILAEIVTSVRSEPPRTGGHTGVTENTAPAPTTAVDPVCGMTVAAVDSTPHIDLEGKRWWFCCEGCRAAFESDPARYTGAGAH
ncbi:XdhC family protein [Carbonactinospora thermoautotrophica]|uniref:XdhC family protein n=1 Tax=Carbonactinospora thermoautotrophica TaxID=1469144 RepID=UPI00226EDD7B|nr:XdhC family protein [Carbonactinospora thermoautotrophica]